MVRATGGEVTTTLTTKILPLSNGAEVMKKGSDNGADADTCILLGLLLGFVSCLGKGRLCGGRAS